VEAEVVIEYDDIVTQEDIDYLHEHARKNYGSPKFVRSSECGWDYTLDILCLMALADAFGFEYGEFVN
jgi:hypothetical protein